MEVALPIAERTCPNGALFEACLAGQTELALSLVRTQGADVHAKDHDEQTPLHYAAAGGHVATIRALVLDLGASVDACGHRGNPATPLHRAAAAGHCEAVRALVRLGANIRAEDGFGDMPAHSAASAGHTDVVRMFVEEFGFDVEDGVSVVIFTPLNMLRMGGTQQSKC